MPDFDKNLQPIIKDAKLPLEDVRVKAPTPYAPMNVGGSGVSDLSHEQGPFDKLKALSESSNFGEKGVFVTNATLEANKRYKTFNPTIGDYEDFAAYGQSNLDKAANGVLKGLNIAATTIAGTGGLLVGGVKSMFTGRLADIWDNEVTQSLDEWNQKVDNEYLPNYYTQAEKDADWYSPTNWFKTNFLFDKLIKNSGYAVGAMYSGNIANAGFLKAGAALGKFAMAGAAAAESSQAFKLFTPLLRNTARAFSAGKNIETAAILEGRLSNIADLTARTSKIADLAKQTNNFAKIGDVGRRSAVALYSSAGEASFEALQTGNEYRNKLIEEYKATHGGQEPTGSDLAGINSEADSVGATSFFGNMAILSVTEYVQLPYLLGSNYSASKKAANSLLGKTDDVLIKDGKYVAKEATTKFGKIYDKTKAVSKYVFDPKEAAQEGLQYSLQVGTQNYFKKAKESDDASIWTDGVMFGLIGRDESGKGVGALVSKEGMESIALGGITGAMMQIKGNVQESRAVKTNTQRFAEQLNNAPTFKQSFKERLAAANRGVVLQQQQQDAVIQGDKLEAKDLDADMMHNYLAPRIKYGRFDMIMDDISDLRQEGATEQGLAALKQQGYANINDTVQSYQERLTNFETVAKNTEQLYKAIDLRYSGETDEQGNRKYSPEVIDKLVYASSKISNYDLRIPQVNMSLVEAGINTLDILQSIIKNNKPNRTATAEAIKQINELDVTSDVKDELKSQLSDVIELSMRRKLFMEEYDDIKSNPSRYDVAQEFEFGEAEELPVTVSQEDETAPEKKLEVGKEYSLAEPIRKDGSELKLAPKITVLSQTLGGELEVRLPNGKTKFLTPEQFKEYNISDEDNTSKEMADILDESIDAVLKDEKYKDLEKAEEGVSKIDFVNSLDNQSLIDDIEAEFNKRTEELIKKRAEEKRIKQELLKNKENLDKEQDEIEKDNGGVSTGNPETESTSEENEGSLKDAKTFFISGTTESEVYNDPKQAAPHLKRSREFLNNIKKFPNRGKIRAIFVTPKQQAALGLSGLTQISFKKDPSVPLSEIPGSDNPQQALVAQVFVLQEGSKTYFVDKNGNKLTEVGAKDASGNPINADLNEVIFQAMPRAKDEKGEIITKDSTGRNKFRSGQEEEFKAYAEAWAKYREELFKLPEGKYPIFEFTVSRGIPIKLEVNGKPESNHVGEILVPEYLITKLKGLVVIPTTGTIAHNGQLLTFTNGRPVLQYGDTLQFLNNKKFSDKQAKSIFEVIKALSEGYISNKKLDRKYTNFLKNVLFYSSKREGAANRFYVDSSDVIIGKEKFSITNIAENEEKIVNLLKETFNNINNEGLTKNFESPFFEFYIGEDGALTEREWKNYQQYLLSSTYPDGKARPIGETPLNTSVAAPSEAIPYSYQQKYATLGDITLNVQFTPKPAPAKPAEAPTVPAAPTAAPVTKVGDFTIDGTTENTYTLRAGDVKFTAEINAEGKLEVDVLSGETTQKAAADPNYVNVAIGELKKAGQYDEELGKPENAESAVRKFQSLAIAGALEIERKKAATTPAPVTPAPVSTEESVTKPVEPTEDGPTDGPSDDFNDLRAVAPGEEGGMTDAELDLFKEWHAKNVPGIPYEVLENIIKLKNGEKAWGAFENGVAKFVRGGLRGTEYHEVFEGIWKAFLTEEERSAIVDELRASGKDFIDRETGKKLNYATATAKQIKERIADDFSDYRLGKLPARTLGEKIRRFFKAIMDFFKSFVAKPSLKEQLFKSIDTGKFKDKTVSERVKNEAAEYRKIGNLTEKETHEFIQDMTARSSRMIYSRAKEALFSPGGITSDEIFDQIEEQYKKERYKGVIKRDFLGDESWKQLIQKTKESLRTLGVDFNEEDRVDINDVDYNNKMYAPEPFSVDWKRNSTGPVKFTVATLIQQEALNQQGALEIKVPKPSISSVGGYKLVNFSRAFATLLDKLSNTTSVSKAVEKLVDLSKYDSTYVEFFKKIGGKKSTDTINFGDFSNSDWRLFIQTMQTFTKQKPEALVQYIKGNEVYLAPANIFTATNEVKRQWMDNMKMISKKPAKGIPSNLQGQDRLKWVIDNDYKLIRFDSTSKTYKVDTQILNLFPKKDANDMIALLGKIGVEFPIDVYTKLTTNQKNEFAKAVSSIISYFGKEQEVMKFTKETVGINGQLSKLAELIVRVTNPNIESTYFNVEGERVNSYAENNTPSVFENEFNEVATIDELLTLRPELLDIFSTNGKKGKEFDTNSQILKKGGLFFDEDGNRTDKKLKVKYIQGTDNNGKGIPTSKLSLGGRFTQEINQNINGNYYVLIPADGSTEWMMDLGNTISFDDVEAGRAWSKINKVFMGYLMDDVALALDAKNRSKLRNVGNKASELRFFKDILSDKTLSGINNLIQSGATQDQIKEYIDDNIKDVYDSIKEYVDGTVSETRKTLLSNGQVLNYDEDTFSYPELDNNFASANQINKNKMSSEDVNTLLTFANVNYIINNIEYHKIIFGDPYQFEIKDKKGKTILDETKRIKSFLSPRRTTFDSPEYNNRLNTDMNVAGSVTLQEGDPGHHEFKAYANTITLKDDKIVGSLADVMSAYGDVNVADAASWLMDGTYREIKLKNGQWSDEAEAWHQWQMAYTRQNLPKYKYSSEALRKHDESLLSKPAPKHTIEVLKPIVTGVKYGSNNIDLVLDKFSQMPIYYSMVQGTNLEKLYVQMMEQKVGYAIVQSGRKVGAEALHSLYNADGTINDQPFNNNIKVSWKSYGIQVETSFEGPKEQTRGSQLTKLSSMDLFDNGVPTSKDAKEEYERNTKILNEMTLNAYRELVNKLGVVDTGDGFVMPNGKAVSEQLMNEMLRREMSENAKDTIQLDENDQFRIPFEASPSYIQIRNIMYAMIDKALVSPKMSGGSHVQVPVTGFESALKGRALMMKNKEGKYEKISKQKYDSLTEEKKKSVVLTDDTLKFYEDKKGKRYCEVLLPAWFKNKSLGRKLESGETLTDEEIEILSGIGFRIPTQAMSSVEVFRVKGFLPEYMGATVVVPSEITTKAGSDFDIDKLNMYLKATYVDAKGNLRLIKSKGSEEATKQFYAQVFDEKLEQKKINKAELLEAAKIMIYNLEDPKNLGDRYSDLIDEMMGEAEGDPTKLEDYLMKEMEKLGDANIQSVLKEKFVKRMYKKSLENDYYNSLEKMITLPENFKRLISPVGDAGLPTVAERLDDLRGYNESNIKNRMLNRNYLTSLRHAFLLGKKWIGIAAVNITGHSLAQKSKVYVDTSRLSELSREDQKYIGDGSILLDHNKVDVDGTMYASMSGTKTADGTEYISDRLSGYATSFVDVAKDPYILKIIQSDLIVGTFMFLERIGAGKQAAIFLNQPIISEYLKMLDSAGSKGLFTKANISLIKSRFVTTDANVESAKIDLSTENLEKNIEKFYEDGVLSPERNAEQILIFNEFLKYAKMAEFNFKFSQAINYDTTKFRSGDALVRKQWRTEIARKKNIISSVDKIFENSFLGDLEKALGLSMEAMGAIFKLETSKMRAITEGVLRSYGENDYVGSSEFEKIAIRVKSAFLDYIVETKTDVGSRLKELLVDSETAVADRLMILKQKYPNLQILKDLVVDASERPDGAKTVKLVANLKEAYDENLYTGYMRELRDFNEETYSFYKDLVLLSISQGTYQSPVTFKNIVPIEDYSAIVTPAVSALASDESLAAFKSSFSKNNFKDDTVMPLVQPKFFMASEAPVGVQLNSIGEEYADIYQYYSSLFPNINAFKIKSSDRRILLLNRKYNDFYMGNNFIKIPRVVTDRKTGESIDMKTGKTITKMDYAKMKAKGDLSLSDIYGYQRVNLPNGDPVVTYDKDGNEIYAYKLINLLGDGYRAVEHYTDDKRSVFQNGTIQTENVIPDSDIIEYYGGKIGKKDIPSQETTPTIRIDVPMSAENVAKIESGEKTMTLRTQKESDLIGIPVGTTYKRRIGGKDYAVRNRGFLTVQEAGGKDAVLKAEGVQNESELLYDYSKDFVNGKTRLYVYDIKALPESIIPTEQPSGEKVIEGDIFALPGIPVITTNLGGVHGAGLAQLAKAKGLIKQGEGAFMASDKVVQLPVKMKWSDSMATGNNMLLLKESLRSLINVAKAKPGNTYLLPLAGLGHGEGTVSEIMPLLIATVKSVPNIKLVLPAQGVNLGREGTVRKDSTREKMPEIKATLEEAGLIAVSPTVPTAPVAAEPERSLQDIIYKLNIEKNEYRIENINGKDRVVDIRNVPEKIKKGYSKFYSELAGGAFAERYGKKIVVPGFEDINLMMEQDTTFVYELSTGKAIPTEASTQKGTKEELEVLFNNKNIREVIARNKKTDINNQIIGETTVKQTFESEFSKERQESILNNFATKHKMTTEDAIKYINNAIATEGQKVIDKLKECY